MDGTTCETCLCELDLLLPEHNLLLGLNNGLEDVGLVVGGRGDGLIKRHGLALLSLQTHQRGARRYCAGLP